MELPKTSEVPSNIAGTQNKITGLQLAGGRVCWEQFSPTEAGYIFKRNHGFQLAVDPDQLKSLGVTMDVLMDCVKQLEQMGDPEKIKGSIALRKNPGYLANGLVITSSLDPRVKMSVMFHDPDYEDTDFLVAWFIDNEHLDQEMKTDSDTYSPQRTVDADELGPAQAQKQREAALHTAAPEKVEAVDFNEEDLLGLLESAPLNLIDKIRTNKAEYLNEDLSEAKPKSHEHPMVDLATKYITLYLKPGHHLKALAHKLEDKLGIETEIGKDQIHLFTGERSDVKDAIALIGEKNIKKVPQFPDLIPSGMTPLFPKKNEAKLEPMPNLGDQRIKGDMIPYDQLKPEQKKQADSMFVHQTPVSDIPGHNKPISNDKYHYQVDRKGNVSGRRFLSKKGMHMGRVDNLKAMKKPSIESKETKGTVIMEGKNKNVQVSYEKKFEEVNSLSFESVDFWGLPKVLGEDDFTHVGQAIAKPSTKEGTEYGQKAAGKPEYSKTVKEYDSEKEKLQATMKSNETKMNHVQPGDELAKPASKVGDEYGQKDLNKKNIKVGDPKSDQGDHVEGTGAADSDGKQYDELAKNKVKLGKVGSDHGDHVEEAKKMKKKPNLKERIKMKADLKKKRMKSEGVEHETMGVNKDEHEGAPASPGAANRMEQLKKRYEHAKKAYETANKSKTESTSYTAKKSVYEWQKKKSVKQAVR